MTVRECDPTSCWAGVPHRRPVTASNDAQPGLPLMLKLSDSPSPSVAVGWKLYGCPANARVGGMPEICGAWLCGGCDTGGGEPEDGGGGGDGSGCVFWAPLQAASSNPSNTLTAPRACAGILPSMPTSTVTR